MEATAGAGADELIEHTTTVARHLLEARIADGSPSPDAQPYRDLLDALGVAVYTTDADGVITYFNAAAAELWGRHPEVGTEEWCGSWKMYHLDGVTVMPHSECPMAACLKENRPIRDVEGIAERPDGSRVYFQPFPTPIRDSSGRAIGAVNVFIDITERKRVEQALRDSESRLSIAMAAGQMGSWEWRIGEDTVTWSEALEQIHGLQPGTFAGTLEAFLADVHPDDRAAVQESIAQSLERGTHEIEYRILVPDGRLRWVLGRGQLVRDATGAATRMVGVCMDITERKQVEEEAAKLAAIVESSDDAIISKDLDGIITSWNPGAERIFGYSSKEAVGKSIRMLIPPDRQHEEDEVISRIRRGEFVDHFETIRRRKDASEVEVSLSVSPIKSRSGEVIGASQIALDISERRRTEVQAREAIERSIQMKDQFLGLVSHELRTPITTILGNALILLRRNNKLPEDTRRQALGDVANEAERLQRIIENLLLLTRVDTDEHVDTEPLRLQPLIAQTVESLRLRNPRRNVEVAYDEELPIVQGRAEFLALVIENLITNGDKYSPPESTIEVLARANGRDDVEVCVRDYGIGLDESDTEHVFTPFYRSARARSQAKGIGLGLAVCKRVMEAQGGSIRAVARPDGGSDFIFSIQRYRDDGE